MCNTASNSKIHRNRAAFNSVLTVVSGIITPNSQLLHIFIPVMISCWEMEMLLLNFCLVCAIAFDPQMTPEVIVLVPKRNLTGSCKIFLYDHDATVIIFSRWLISPEHITLTSGQNKTCSKVLLHFIILDCKLTPRLGMFSSLRDSLHNLLLNQHQVKCKHTNYSNSIEKRHCNNIKLIFPETAVANSRTYQTLFIFG